MVESQVGFGYGVEVGFARTGDCSHRKTLQELASGEERRFDANQVA